MSAPRRSFFAELRRRSVYKVGAMYAVAGWLLVQVVTQVFPIFEISALAQRIIVLVIVAGFPLALVLAWLFDITPDGIVRTDGLPADAPTPAAARERRGLDRKLKLLLGALLLCALAYLVLDRALLRPPLAGAGEASAASIAVLPFQNLSSDPDNAYFADGIQDEILTRLAKIGALKVISRTSTQRYAARPAKLSDIGRQLGVTHILEGSVQKASGSVHINVQLIRADTDEHLWAESYNRKLDDVFAVEVEVAQAVADQLRAKLSSSEARQLAEQPTLNPAAYDAYLRGLAFARRIDNLRVNTLSAIAALEEAVRLDPGFAQAWAEVAELHAFAHWNFDKSERHRQAAREARDTAMRLAPERIETLRAQAFYAYWLERDYAGAQRIFERVLARAPNDEVAVSALAAIARRQGRWPQSLVLWQRAIDLDPRNTFTLVDAVATALSMRDFAAAQRWGTQGLNVEPDSTALLATQVTMLQAMGELDRAQAILDRVRVAPGDDLMVSAFMSQACLSRRYAPAIELLQQQLREPDALGSGLGAYQLWLADAQRLAGDAAAAQQNYHSALQSLTVARREQPGDPSHVASLALVEAGLGRREAALALAAAAVQLLPISQDAYIGPVYLETQVRLQARFNDRDTAIAGLRQLLAMSYGGPPLTPALLLRDPDFDALRDDPRFQQLVAGSGG